jgi:ribonuclease-3
MKQSLLSYEFNNVDLKREALTHRSAGSRNYERLEFLGDSILSLVISNELFQKQPKASEGELSRLRASLVNGEKLADIAQSLGIGEHVILGPGELKSGGYRRASILADVVEALLGAIYLDGGFEVCRDTILEIYADSLANLPDPEALKDPKTRLQEFLQSRKFELPEYSILEETGKAHNRHYKVKCMINELDIDSVGEGSSRRKAEQAAAANILDRINAQ